MKTSVNTDQRGVAHLGLILLLVVVVGMVGFAGWRVTQKGKEKDSSLATAVKQVAAKCDLDDKDLCKFMTSWKNNKYYTVKTVDTSDGKSSQATYQSEGTDKFHMSATGENSFEMITIGDTSYTKDAKDGKWWKQTLKPEEKKQYSMDDNLKFDDSSKDEPEADKTTYKKLSKEPCGNRQCFKYQVIDPENKGSTEFIWFDDQDYQLRREMTQNADGSKSEMTFSYDKVSITAPSPVKEVAPNQVVIPGASQPMDMPSDAEMQQLMQQYAPDAQ
jgi:outer membrane lipoprotein-sorting protein